MFSQVWADRGRLSAGEWPRGGRGPHAPIRSTRGTPIRHPSISGTYFSLEPERRISFKVRIKRPLRLRAGRAPAPVSWRGAAGGSATGGGSAPAPAQEPSPRRPPPDAHSFQATPSSFPAFDTSPTGSGAGQRPTTLPLRAEGHTRGEPRTGLPVRPRPIPVTSVTPLRAYWAAASPTPRPLGDQARLDRLFS